MTRMEKFNGINSTVFVALGAWFLVTSICLGSMFLVYSRLDSAEKMVAYAAILTPMLAAAGSAQWAARKQFRDKRETDHGYVERTKGTGTGMTGEYPAAPRAGV